MEIKQIYFCDFELMTKKRYKDLKNQVRILETLAKDLSSILEEFSEKTNNK